MSLNMILSVVDTDSITFSKPDFSPFSEEEKEILQEDLNSHFDELITWELEAVYRKIIVLKTKNYILDDPTAKKEKDKIKIKGSALRSSTREKALKDFMNEIINSIIEEKYNYQEIYHKYVVKAMNITKDNIKDWSAKKTLTSKVYDSERANETKVLEAIADTEYVEGDKIWVFFKENGDLELVERFNDEYDRIRMVEKLFKTSKTFANIIPEGTFINYKLKRNLPLLNELCNIEQKP